MAVFGPQMNVLNSPQQVRINADSIGKYFLQLPLEFIVSRRVSLNLNRLNLNL